MRPSRTLTTTFAAGSADGSALISPTTPFSQSTLPSKSLLSRASTDNTILDPTFQPATKDGRSASVAQILDNSTEAALQRVIERLFESCLREGRYRQVVGIAVEAKNLEVLRSVIKRASEDETRPRPRLPRMAGQGPAEELMEYALGICMDVVQERSFRTEILRLILDLLNDIPNPDYFAIAKCVVYLDSDDEASTMLRTARRHTATGPRSPVPTRSPLTCTITARRSSWARSSSPSRRASRPRRPSRSTEGEQATEQTSPLLERSHAGAAGRRGREKSCPTRWPRRTRISGPSSTVARPSS